jgi:hypothetical protein
MSAEWATAAGEVVLAAGLDVELRDLHNHEVHHAYRRETVLPIMPRGKNAVDSLTSVWPEWII